LFSIHHAIDDGWGNQNLLAELFEIYTRLRQGEFVRVEGRPNVFKEYVALERETAESPLAQAFWAPRLDRPAAPAFARRAEPAADATVSTLLIDADRAAGLQAFARGQSVSLKAVLLAACLRLVGEEGNTPTPCVGVVTNGRSDRLSDPLGGFGLFWNLLPFALNGQPDAATASDAELVRSVQAELSEMESFALYPATRVAQRKFGREPFQATFNFIDFHNAARLENDAALALVYQDSRDKFHAPLNYAFSVDRTGGAVVVRVECDPAYFDANDIARLNDRLLQHLAALTATAAGPTIPLAHPRTPVRDANSAVEMT
jgi:Condensation domain